MKPNPTPRNWPLLLGMVFLFLGTGPLAIVMLAAKLGYGADPNPNPVLVGMLAGLTFYPSLGLIAWGIYRRRKQQYKAEK